MSWARIFRTNTAAVITAVSMMSLLMICRCVGLNMDTINYIRVIVRLKGDKTTRIYERVSKVHFVDNGYMRFLNVFTATASNPEAWVTSIPLSDVDRLDILP